MELAWDDENEAHLAAHGLDATIVTDLVELGVWVLVRDTRRRTRPRRGGERRRLIGYDPDGRWWTVVLEPTAVAGLWRPVTGWPATPRERAIYQERRNRSHG